MENIEVESLFLKKLGEPNTKTDILNYLDFINEHKVVGNSLEYCEKHHILPISSFPEYKRCSWNIVKLTYKCHIAAHELLFIAYPIRANQFPLRFMQSQISKNSELISKASKGGWKKLKQNNEKYNKFIENRSGVMSSLPGEEQSRRSNLAWERLRIDPIKYEERCKKVKDSWTDTLKLKKSEQMKLFISNHPGEISRRGIKRWKNVTPEYKEQFRRTVTDSLNLPEIKEKISIGVKQKWDNFEFRNKMKFRRTRDGIFELISPAGEIFKRVGMNKIIKEFQFCPELVRKSINIGKPVISKNSKNKQSIKNTIGWTFNKITK